jgi:large-conductance mechanosensitive channel
MKVEPIQSQTFFVRHGDYLSRILNIASFVFLAIVAIFKLRKRTAKKMQHAPATDL